MKMLVNLTTDIYDQTKTELYAFNSNEDVRIEYYEKTN